MSKDKVGAFETVYSYIVTYIKWETVSKLKWFTKTIQIPGFFGITYQMI